MPDAAIRKNIVAAKAMLEAGSALTFHIDRTDDEPLAESERPGVIVRVPNVEFRNYASQGMDLVSAAVLFDFYSSGTAGETIDAQNQNNIAETMKLIAGDRTLGGRLQEWEATAATGSEEYGADAGCAILETEMLFFVLRDDPFVIAGQGGVQF